MKTKFNETRKYNNLCQKFYLQVWPEPIKPEIWNLPFFFAQINGDFHTILTCFSCWIFSLVFQKNLPLLSCSSIGNRWSQRKSMRVLYDEFPGMGHMPIGSCMTRHRLVILLFLVTWVDKITCWASKAVIVMGKETTDICICAYKVGNFRT